MSFLLECGTKVATCFEENGGALKVSFDLDQSGCGGKLSKAYLSFKDSSCSDKLEFSSQDLSDAGCGKFKGYDTELTFDNDKDGGCTKGEVELRHDDRDLTLDDVKGCKMGLTVEETGESGEETVEVITELPSTSDEEYAAEEADGETPDTVAEETSSEDEGDDDADVETADLLPMVEMEEEADLEEEDEDEDEDDDIPGLALGMA